MTATGSESGSSTATAGELPKIVGLMRISESVTLTGPALATVLAALDSTAAGASLEALAGGRFIHRAHHCPLPVRHRFGDVWECDCGKRYASSWLGCWLPTEPVGDEED